MHRSQENSKQKIDTFTGLPPTPPANPNLTASEIQERRDKINSLPTIEQIMQNPSLVPKLFEFPEGINIPGRNSVYNNIDGYTEEQLKQMEASYHLGHLSVIPKSLTTDSDGIYEFPNWLPASVCDQLIQRSNPNLVDSDPFYSTTNGLVVKITNSITRMIHDNIKNVTNLPVSYYETMVVRKYPVGGLYKDHSESIPEVRNLSVWDRVMMVQLFLNDDYTGGEKVFTYSKRTITPQKGKLIIYWCSEWNSNSLVQSKSSSSSENPVLSGTKWTASFGIHSRDKWVPSLAKLLTVEDNF